MEQADRLLDGLPAERVPRSLEAADTFMKVANWNLSQERFQTVAKRFNVLDPLFTSVDMTDSQGISFDLLSAITAVRRWGEAGPYDQLRELTIKRFANSKNVIVAEQVIKATMLEPINSKDLKK